MWFLCRQCLGTFILKSFWVTAVCRFVLGRFRDFITFLKVWLPFTNKYFLRVQPNVNQRSYLQPSTCKCFSVCTSFRDTNSSIQLHFTLKGLSFLQKLWVASRGGVIQSSTFGTEFFALKISDVRRDASVLRTLIHLPWMFSRHTLNPKP